MAYDTDNVFAKILRGEIPSTKVYEDDVSLAFNDIGAVRLFNNGKLFVVRREHGFLALSRWCTHMNGLLQWKPNHWHFYCPYHKATFNREGASTSHTPFDTLPPMRLHPIVIDADGILKVDTDVLLIRKQADENDAVPPTPGAASDVSRYECIAGDAP